MKNPYPGRKNKFAPRLHPTEEDLSVGTLGCGAPVFPLVNSELLPYSVQRRITRLALMPPNPKEFDRATSKLCGIALLGT